MSQEQGQHGQNSRGNEVLKEGLPGAVEKKGWRDMVPGLSDGGGPAADQGLCTLLVEEF